MMPTASEAACAWAAGLGHTFARPDYLIQALTHSTYANEHPGSPAYERLEFLGDAVLQLLVSEHLFAAMPHAPEGDLSRRRAQLVREGTLASLAEAMALAPHLRLGSGQQEAAVARSILADAVEAVLAAVFLDAGIEAARAFFVPWLERAHVLGDAHLDFKTRLQEWCHSAGKSAPHYSIAAISGPAHDRRYHVTLALGEGPVTRGEGTSKKRAEQLCARRALEALGLSHQS